MKKSSKIPVNIITGFLGAGKTTSILHLLLHKSVDEKWAVLVNEFGEVGVDGALLRSDGVHVKEVPGGCICCVTNLPMRIALSNILQRVNPHRLIIEPTGLGHPQQIIAMLAAEQYQDLLEIRATITVVDGRKLVDPRYLKHPVFMEQLCAADCIAINKIDLMDDGMRDQCAEALNKIAPDVTTAWCQQGKLEPAWLDDSSRLLVGVSSMPPARRSLMAPLVSVPTLPVEIPPEADYVRRENSGEGFRSCGWLFSGKLTFDFSRVFACLARVFSVRAKAVIITERGIYGFNAENGVLDVRELAVSYDSRVEIIHDGVLPWDDIEKALLASCNYSPA